MSKVNRIPDISDERLLELYRHIRPVRKDTWGKMRWLRKLNLKELRGTSVTWSDELLADPVEETGAKLRELGPFRCLHTWSAPALFHPTVAEVLAQIPEELVSQVGAFEIIAPTTMYGIVDDEFVSKAFKEGYHVSTVVLYALD